MTKFYNHYRSESFDYEIGHMSNDGVVYNHWQKESLTYAVGHVRNGVVYNHYEKESLTYAIGHVDRKGVVYNHHEKESLTYAIGHVDRNGVVYDHHESESLSHAIGHVRGSAYAGGAALLLLHASFHGPVVDHRPPINDEEWRKEKLEHEETMRRLEAERKIREAKYREYEKNPQITAAAREYAQQRVKAATIVTPLFILLVSAAGFKNMSGEAVLPVLAIWGLFILAMTLFIRHMACKNAYQQKVWELGEQGFGKEVPKKTKTEKKSTPKTTSKTTPKTEGKPTSKTEAKPTPKTETKPVQSKIATCPHCSAKCRVPAGNGKIEITCPNPDCKTPFTFDS